MLSAPDVLFISAADPTAVTRLFDDVDQRLGDPDIVVYNASARAHGPIAEIDPAEVMTARARIPSLQHGRRFEIIEPMAEPTHLHVVGGEA